LKEKNEEEKRGTGKPTSISTTKIALVLQTTNEHIMNTSQTHQSTILSYMLNALL
jgi:hypothetical protein